MKTALLIIFSFLLPACGGDDGVEEPPPESLTSFECESVPVAGEAFALAPGEGPSQFSVLVGRGRTQLWLTYLVGNNLGGEVNQVIKPMACDGTLGPAREILPDNSGDKGIAVVDRTLAVLASGRLAMTDIGFESPVQTSDAVPRLNGTLGTVTLEGGDLVANPEGGFLVSGTYEGGLVALQQFDALGVPEGDARTFGVFGNRSRIALSDSGVVYLAIRSNQALSVLRTGADGPSAQEVLSRPAGSTLYSDPWVAPDGTALLTYDDVETGELTLLSIDSSANAQLAPTGERLLGGRFLGGSDSLAVAYVDEIDSMSHRLVIRTVSLGSVEFGLGPELEVVSTKLTTTFWGAHVANGIYFMAWSEGNTISSGQIYGRFVEP